MFIMAMLVVMVQAVRIHKVKKVLAAAEDRLRILVKDLVGTRTRKDWNAVMLAQRLRVRIIPQVVVVAQGVRAQGRTAAWV